MNLADAFTHDFKRVSEFFVADPQQLLREPEKLFGQQRTDLRPEIDVQELLNYNKTLGCTEKTAANIDLLSDPETIVVVAGQQPGLCTGPLYTIYKALATIRLAHLLSERLWRPVVPVFWVVSEDHDFDEIAWVSFPSEDDRVQRLGYRPENPPDGRSYFALPCDNALKSFIDQYRGALPRTEFADEAFASLFTSLERSRNVAEFFAQTVVQLFGQHGLVLFSPELACGRRAAIPILQAEITRPGRSSAMVNEAGRALVGMGFHQQTERKEDQLNFFRYVGGQRSTVRWANDRFSTNGVDGELSSHKLSELVETEPQSFSPAVVLRPLVQMRLFPQCVSIVGPGEIGYWAQLKPLFREFDLPLPCLFPRPSVTLVEKSLERILNKYSITSDELGLSRQELIEHVLRNHASTELATSFDMRQRALNSEMTTLADQLAQIDPTLAARAEKVKSKIEYELGKLREKALLSQKHRSETLERQIERVRTHLQPLGKPQERVFNVYYYLNKYGPGLLDMLLHQIDISQFDEQMIVLD